MSRFNSFSSGATSSGRSTYDMRHYGGLATRHPWMVTMFVITSLALLYDGTILISGGQDTTTDTLASQEVFDPVGGGFSPVIPLQQPRFGATSTTLPLNGVLIVGGEDITASTSTDVDDAELYSPILLSAALHPKFKVLNILYAPPGSGSNMMYTDANTMGSSTGTENSFAHAFSLSYTFSLNNYRLKAGRLGCD